MEVEVRSNDATTRKVLQEKVNGYKKSMSNMKTDFNAAKDQADRESLLGGAAGKSLEQRQRLLDTNEKWVLWTVTYRIMSTISYILYVAWHLRIDRQNETIMAAVRTVAETEVKRIVH